jgi:GH24 family phage-related lysozyme (muramidase)
MADAVAYNVERLGGSVGKENWDRMTGGQKLALTSWAYNIGETAVRGSTLAKRIKAGEHPAVVLRQELPKWNDKGRAARRRAEEVAFAASDGYE